MSSTLSRAKMAVGRAIGYVICEPQLRLARRHHDNTCDHCGVDCDGWEIDRLTFPIEDYSPSASSSIEKLRAMWNAEYNCYCMECAAYVNAGKTPPGEKGERA